MRRYLLGSAVLAGLLTYALPLSPAWAAGGALDPGFGTGGTVLASFGEPVTSARAVAIQPDGKIVVTGKANGWGVERFNADGTADTTFGTGGQTVTSFGAASDSPTAIAIQRDGKIVTAGFYAKQVTGGEEPTYLSSEFALARYNPDGTADTTFGTGGKVITNMSGAGLLTGDDNAQVSGITIQPDGKIIAAGWTGVAGNMNVALARYNANGTLDRTFGSGGRVLSDTGGTGTDDQSLAVALQPDGKIVAAGSAFVPGRDFDFAILRYTSSGVLDSTFGTGGVTLTDFTGGGGSTPGYDAVHAVAVQPDGKIVAGGEARTATGDSFALARYNADGSPDPGFGTGGKILTTFASPAAALAMALQPDGEILAAGSGFTLARYRADGTLDPDFGTNGTVITSFGDGHRSICEGMALQPDGKIVAAGESAPTPSSAFTSIALARYLP